MKRAVFLDRDGTINEEKEYLSDPDKLVLFPGTGPALRRLMDAGFLLFIITNQSGIGRGYYTLDDMHRVYERLCEWLSRDGVRFEKIYYSPEAPDQPGRGRKPSPQFLFDARDEFGLDLAQSYMIGDKLIDLECGWNAGVKESILVRTGYGKDVEKQFPEKLANTWKHCNLTQAVDGIFDESVSQHLSRLRAARAVKGLSEHEVAALMGISSACYYDIEACWDELIHVCRLKDISNLCRILGLPARDLFRDYAVNLSAPMISFGEVLGRVTEHCRLRRMSIGEFEDVAGWRLSECLADPKKAVEDWCVDCLRDICREIGIDWFQVVAGL